MASRKTFAVEDLPDVGQLVSSDQLSALNMEIKTAAYYLDLGLAALEEVLEDRHDFFPAPMQLLGSGLEHLLKTTLALGTLQVEGRPPTIGRVKRVIGHDIRLIRDLVVLEAHVPPLSSSEVSEGLVLGSRVLVASPLMERLLEILSDYGARDRYHYLNGFLQPNPTREDPFREFLDWLHRDAAEASRDLTESSGEEEFSPLVAHVIADRPAAFIRDRKRVVYLHLLGFISVTSMFCVWFRGDGEEGPLRPFIRARTLLRPPKPWFMRSRRSA